MLKQTSRVISDPQSKRVQGEVVKEVLYYNCLFFVSKNYLNKEANNVMKVVFGIWK